MARVLSYRGDPVILRFHRNGLVLVLQALRRRVRLSRVLPIVVMGMFSSRTSAIHAIGVGSIRDKST